MTSRFLGGWIKIHRDLLLNEIAKNGDACLGLWVKLLCMASVQEAEVTRAGRSVKLPPGTVVTSLPELAGSNNPAVISRVRRGLKWLETRQSIRQESDRHGRVIFIMNWERYQDASEIRQTIRQESDTVLKKKEKRKEKTHVLSASAEKHVSEEFDKIYQKYPSRLGNQGKRLGRDRFFRHAKKRSSFIQQFGTAVSNYSDYVRERGIEGTQYVMQFSTFLNRWEDWVASGSSGSKNPSQEQVNLLAMTPQQEREFLQAQSQQWRERRKKNSTQAS